jgi:hypothetical protein
MASEIALDLDSLILNIPRAISSVDEQKGK